eukprot:3735030-Rhodomonas_salina.1
MSGTELGYAATRSCGSSCYFAAFARCASSRACEIKRIFRTNCTGKQRFVFDFAQLCARPTPAPVLTYGMLLPDLRLCVP